MCPEEARWQPGLRSRRLDEIGHPLAIVPAAGDEGATHDCGLGSCCTYWISSNPYSVDDARKLVSSDGVVSRDGRNTSAILEVMLSSTRRVKKGRGVARSRPTVTGSMGLRERGLTIDAAAREVGVSRTAGMKWANGYRTYRAGQVVGFVASLDRLEVREISPRFLSEDERVELADLLRAQAPVSE